MVSSPIVEVWRGMFGVHSHIRKVADCFRIEECAQGVFNIVPIEVRFNIEEQASLHGHTPAAEPLFLEIGYCVPVLIREIEVIFVILEDPIGLPRMRIQSTRDQQMQRTLQRFTDPPEASTTTMHLRRNLGYGGAIAQPHYRRSPGCLAEIRQ